MNGSSGLDRLLARTKHALKTASASAGLFVRRTHAVPFGVCWQDDLRWYLGDRHPVPCFVDVGANVGQTALRLVTKFPESVVYSFEPVATTYAKLLANTSRFKNIKCVNAAVGMTRGQAHMTADRDGRNSLRPEAVSLETELVDVTTIDDFAAERGLDRLQLLKIDTEGFEMQVLEGARRMLASNAVDFVLAECDFEPRVDEPHGNFREIFDFLSARGFHLVSSYTGGVDTRGWMWGDVLMMCEGACPAAGFGMSPFAEPR